MDVLATIAAIGFAIALLGGVVSLLSKIKLSQELGRKDRVKLEQLVFRYEHDYFAYIGHEHPDAVAFRRLVETRDLKGIQENWSKLSNSFVRLETRAGWRGRPLIMDYYYAYEKDLAALAERGT